MKKLPCFSYLRGRRRQSTDKDLGGISTDKNIKLYSFNELVSATDNFNRSNKIGRGGFGTVYKGTLKNGLLVAVKVLSAESKQGNKEFLTEIDIITNVKHPNLIELIGCCVEGSNRILVYEYAENNSLDHALLGSNSEPAKLSWQIRRDICIGTARGLAYLHDELQPPIVHRDIKASNILLGSDFTPKIGDFGLAKLFPDNVTHISTRVAGTTGYLAPEYAMQGQLTKNADVYSFGVLVIEIISGKSSSRSNWSEVGKFLLEWTWQLFKEKRLNEVIDTALGEYPEEEVLRFIKTALFCTQAAASRRPQMRQVVEMLSKPKRLNEKELTPPGYSVFSGKNSKATSSSSSAPYGKSTMGHSAAPSTLYTATVTELVPR